MKIEIPIGEFLWVAVVCSVDSSANGICVEVVLKTSVVSVLSVWPTDLSTCIVFEERVVPSVAIGADILVICEALKELVNALIVNGTVGLLVYSDWERSIEVLIVDGADN